jgi:hypothetical protein
MGTPEGSENDESFRRTNDFPLFPVTRKQYWPRQGKSCMYLKR